MQAKVGDTVTIHYVAKLANGKTLDSSREREKPFTFVLGEKKVIEGLDQGVVGMKVAQLRKLTIPYELAYGANGHRDYKEGKKLGWLVPPKATVIYEVELIEITRRSC